MELVIGLEDKHFGSPVPQQGTAPLFVYVFFVLKSLSLPYHPPQSTSVLLTAMPIMIGLRISSNRSSLESFSVWFSLTCLNHKRYTNLKTKLSSSPTSRPVTRQKMTTASGNIQQ